MHVVSEALRERAMMCGHLARPNRPACKLQVVSAEGARGKAPSLVALPLGIDRQAQERLFAVHGACYVPREPDAHALFMRERRELVVVNAQGGTAI